MKNLDLIRKLINTDPNIEVIINGSSVFMIDELDTLGDKTINIISQTP